MEEQMKDLDEMADHMDWILKILQKIIHNRIVKATTGGA